MMKRYAIIVVCLLLALAACRPSVTEITGVDRDAVLRYAEPITDMLLQAFNEGSYQHFSKYFDDRMKQSISEEDFAQLQDTITPKIGRYLSREVSQTLSQGQLTIVIYKAKFEREEDVEIKVVFQRYGDEHLVSGLWFNSPKLRQ